LCVYHAGQCVVDLCGGWTDDSSRAEPYTADRLQLVFSVSKGVLAAAVAVCVERGWLNYDVAVARYWPEFGVNGKEVSDRSTIVHRVR
jgi:CubicO group peptidase (beta-lactamase class C family)